MIRISRQSWLLLFIAAMSALFVYAVNRASSTAPSIEFRTCQPSDVWARISRAYDPLGFWVEQTIVLEGTYSQDALHECNVAHGGDTASKKVCFARVQKIQDSAQRCLSKAQEMCRREGGKC